MQRHVISVPEIQGTYESIIASGPSRVRHYKRLKSVTTIYSTGGSSTQYIVSIGDDIEGTFMGIAEAVDRYNDL